MVFRKKYTKEQAKEKIKKLEIMLGIEEEFLATFNPKEDNLVSMVFRQEGGYEVHYKKIKKINEEIEYAKKFL